MVNLIVMILTFLGAWIYLYPEDAKSTVIELKRSIRLKVIHRSGTEGARKLAQALHEQAAKQEIDPKLVNQVLIEHYDLIVQRLGSRYADQILGKPDSTESYF